LATGKAVPERPIARVPELVIGDPEIDRNAGTVADTDVTVPAPGKAEPVCQDNTPLPLVVRTWFGDPSLVGRVNV
jgi:hypothetical protein